MARLKATPVGLALRDALAVHLRDCVLVVAERYEALGLPNAGDRARAALAALDAGEPVEVSLWDLGAALADLGAPTTVTRDVLNGAHPTYLVDEEGDYQPTHHDSAATAAGKDSP